MRFLIPLLAVLLAASASCGARTSLSALDDDRAGQGGLAGTVTFGIGGARDAAGGGGGQGGVFPDVTPDIRAEAGRDASVDVRADADAGLLRVVDIALGGSHTCALLSSGAVRCWGDGVFGQLGTRSGETIGDDETPDSRGEVDVGGRVVQISANGSHTCVVLENGAVRCWGFGYSGQLGYGNRMDVGDDETPASAGEVDVGGRVVQIATGAWHTCALLGTGAVRCWGSGSEGLLGYGNVNTIGDDETPASAGDVDVGGRVVQIAASYNHTCALLDTGTVRCWGHGLYGALGHADTRPIGDDETPASAGDADVGGRVVEISAGAIFTCARLQTGAVRCWGHGGAGKLGHGNTKNIGDDETPASAGDIDLGGAAVQISSSAAHTCALLASGAVRCWGLGASGELGHANTRNIGDDETPASAGDIEVGARVTRIVTGATGTCALLASAAVRCWGYGVDGRLGYGNTKSIGDDETPASAGDVPIF